MLIKYVHVHVYSLVHIAIAKLGCLFYVPNCFLISYVEYLYRFTISCLQENFFQFNINSAYHTSLAFDATAVFNTSGALHLVLMLHSLPLDKTTGSVSRRLKLKSNIFTSPSIDINKCTEVKEKKNII